MIKILRLLGLFILISNLAWAQASQSGEIYGKVLDDKKQPLDFVSVQAFEGGIGKGGGKTDLNGNYKIKPLSPGRYTLRVSVLGFQTQEIQNITVKADGRTEVDFNMEKKVNSATKDDKGVIVKEYRNKLIDKDNAGSKAMDRKEMLKSATNSTGDFAAMQSGTYQKKSGEGGISIGGSRSDATIYMVDGIPIRNGGGRGSVNFPPGTIDQLELISNGMSAKYGNATGGVVGITLRGIQRKFGGSLQMQHSVEGYNQNFVSVDLAGPLYSAKKGTVKRPIVGFSLNGSVNYDKDGNPNIEKNYKVKDDVMKNLEDKPLVGNPSGAGNFVRSAELLTAKDFERVKAKQNVASYGANFNLKLDFQPTENIGVTLFTNFLYNNNSQYSLFNSVFSPDANTNNINFSNRSYARLTQKLGKSTAAMKESDKKSAVTNAYYAIQFIYQKDKDEFYNPNHGDDIFNYNYLGKFTTHRHENYQASQTKAGLVGITKGADQIDSTTFVASGINPVLENYTKAIYNDGRFPVRELSDIRQYNGLLNGDNPQSTFGGLYSGVGSQLSSYFKRDATQININMEASFDIEQGANNIKLKDKITHNIQFGLGYEQRTTSSYNLGNLVGTNMWQLMRLLTNRHISTDTMPQYWVDGKSYNYQDILDGNVMFSPFDTITYRTLVDTLGQSRFDQELRVKLGMNKYSTNTLDIDSYDPKTFSLNMFSADDLLNDGNYVVNYVGFDPYGKKLKNKPSFNDFWTKKDSRDDYARPIGAFNPIYMYGYILDKFSYKDLSFNIGLRIDRYDANQKVLKDPYSLYGTRKIGDIKSSDSYNLAIDKSDNDKKAPLPSSFGSDYTVYIDNNQASSPTIVGYRKGDTWYDPFGKEVSDPTILSELYGGGQKIQPWLINKSDSIKSANYNISNAFQDYKPQIVLSPRIKFAFPISEEALFYGNYDVVAQQPSLNSPTADDYYYLVERQAGIQNGNLKMEKGINYSLGYQQRLSKSSSLTIEASYRERRDMVQLQQFTLAYPVTYTSTGNRDFSSTKAMTVRFDFRRSGPFKLNIDYTLQFAEGTGSSNQSQAALLASGQPNLRTVFPLDVDSRHIFNTRIDYRYENDNKGPKIGKIYPLKDAGINLILRTRSGEPYTRTALATPIVGGDFNSTPITGTVMGSRLPWNTELSLRVDKAIRVMNVKAKANKEGTVIRNAKPIFVNLYCLINNVLNTKNTLNVYRYTGSGEDDGYLESPQGVQALGKQQNPESFETIYRMRMMNPDNFNNPRRIYFGLTFDF